jgi:hypothetical protein
MNSVPKFVILESDVTFTGKKKPLVLKNYLDGERHSGL